MIVDRRTAGQVVRECRMHVVFCDTAPYWLPAWHAQGHRGDRFLERPQFLGWQVKLPRETHARNIAPTSFCRLGTTPPCIAPSDEPVLLVADRSNGPVPLSARQPSFRLLRGLQSRPTELGSYRGHRLATERNLRKLDYGSPRQRFGV